MTGKNNDWTDELRDLIEGVELTPSEGGWDRLKADLHPRRAAWWPYAVPAAACLLIGGVFLFREQPSGNVLDAAPAVPSAMVAEAAGVEEVPSLQPEGLSLAAEEGQEDIIHGKNSVIEPVSSGRGPSPDSEPTMLQGVGIENSSEISEIVDADFHEETVEIETTIEAVSDGPAPEVGEEPVQPFLNWPAPSFDIVDEAVVRQRKQRRKITVTVSAGGVFGSAGSGIYIAQAGPSAPVTKADAGRVMDITEVIQHSAPVQKALGISIPISDKLDIGTGMDHMELNSVVGPGSQSLEWIGVPLRLGYSIASWGPSSINLAAGVKGEKCLSASLLGMDYNEPFQWAANFGADFKVRIIGPVSISLMPEMSYYLTDTVLPTYRTGHPLTFTMHAGLSFNL